MPVTERRIRQALGRAPLPSAWELQRLKAKDGRRRRYLQILETACVLYCECRRLIVCVCALLADYREWGESKSVFIVTQESSRWQLDSHYTFSEGQSSRCIFTIPPLLSVGFCRSVSVSYFFTWWFRPFSAWAGGRMRRGCFRKFTHYSKEWVYGSFLVDWLRFINVF